MLKLTQEMKLVQKLDFRMIQSLKLLPLTIMQLEQRMNEELEQNPMLQMDETLKQEEVKPRRSGRNILKTDLTVVTAFVRKEIQISRNMSQFKPMKLLCLIACLSNWA